MRLVFLLALAACARSQAPAPAADAPAPTPPPAAAPAPAAPPGEAPTLFADMVGHVAWATVARDALVAGDVARAKRELAALADHEPHQGLSEAQQAMTIALRQTAAAAAEATHSTDVARVLARVATRCAACHSQQAVLVQFDTPPPGSLPTVVDHMGRHVVAVDRLWEGLLGPSEASWRAGTGALAEDALRSPTVTHDADRGHAVDVMARFVHEQGTAALEATEPGARAELFAQLIATCADCHAETRPR